MEDQEKQDQASEITPVTRWQDLLALAVRWKSFIVVLTMGATILAVVLSLLMPNWYRSTASILPPRDMMGGGALGGGAGNLLRTIAGARLNPLMSSGGFYNYLAVLKSRSAMEEVIRQFDLFSVYDIPDTLMDRAIKELTEHIELEVETEEYLAISVYDRDRQRAADMANYLVEILNRISIQLSTQEARNNREFLAERVDAIKQSLAAKEDSMKAFQKESGTLLIFDERAQGLEAVVELYALKEKKEIELAILRRTVSFDNALVEQAKVEVDELNKRIATIPETGLKSLRLFREVAIQQKILEYIIPLFEQARIDEQKNVPVLLVLDRAVPAERKAYPKRSLIVLSVFVASLLASLLWALSSERYRRLVAQRPEVQTNLRELFRWWRRTPSGN